MDVLRSATSINADIFGLEELGQIKVGFLADLVVIKGNVRTNISTLRNTVMVLKGGDVVLNKLAR